MLDRSQAGVSGPQDATLVGPPDGARASAPPGRAAPDPHLGRLLGGCAITRQLGKGGMATVYLATQQGLDREVAVKVLSPKLCRNKREVEQFFQEAKTIASIEHPNIVTIYSVGEQDETRFLVLQLIRDGSLQDLLKARGGKVPPAEAVEFTKQIARGLYAAHTKGIIHRDIKPHNVLVHGETLKITDFGLAVMDAGEGSAFGAGRVVGTPHYMSPEQVDAQSVDARTDLYALGASLYQMVTGAPPFSAGSTIDLLLKQVSEPPRPPHEVEPACPEWLSRVTLRLLAKDPDQRYATGQDLIEDLEAQGGEEAAKAAPPPARDPGADSILLQPSAPPLVPAPIQPRRSPLVAYGALLLIGLALGLGAAGRGALADVMADEEPVSNGRAELLEEGATKALARLEETLAKEKVGPLEAAARLRTFAVTHEGRAAAKAALELATQREQEAARARAQELAQKLAAVDGALEQLRFGPALDLLAALGTLVGDEEVRAAAERRARASQELLRRGLAWVSPGEFRLGEAEAQVTRYLDGFYVQLHEVSCADYAAFVEQTGAAAPAGWVDGQPAAQDRELPVTEISLEQALAYAEWRGMRLPLSSEWEKAARGTDGRTWPWGEEADPARCRWGVEASLAPCGAHPGDRSPYGCLDMAGNARELTLLRREATNRHPRLHGGGVGSETFANTRAAFSISGFAPSDRSPSVGFRCVSDALPPERGGAR